MYEWVYSFSLAGFFVVIFFLGEIARQAEIEDKSLRECINHLTSRCDYRLMLMVNYALTTIIIALCLYSYI